MSSLQEKTSKIEISNHDRMKSSSFSISQSSPLLDELSPSDRALFCSFGAGPRMTPSHPTVTKAIEHISMQHPNVEAAIAVGRDGNLDYSTAISYGDLSCQSDKLAAHLHDLGVQNDSVVCLFLKRCVPMIVGISAILKTGACYVPQHVGVAPPEQLKFVTKIVEARVVLTISGLLPELPSFEKHVTVLAIDHILNIPSPYFGPFKGPKRTVLASDRCYIIFTSGTTGKCKGVAVTHGNLANVLLTNHIDLGITPGVRVSQILSIAFDMGAWEILGSLTHGGTLIIRDRNINAAVKFADVVISTPSVLAKIDASENTHIKSIAVAGEPCPKALVNRWAQTCRFYNSCGPTEVTIVNTAKRLKPNSSLNIGRPLANNTIYILDPESQLPLKIGEVGEMWAGGECVTAGYINNKAMTTERFVKDPFLEIQDGSAMRMYRTGDLGRWTENGELEHFGRVDDQVKVRGFRVELDGISTLIEEVEEIRRAVVLKIENELVAWVSPSFVSKAVIISHIYSKMPYYCVPDQIIGLDTLPITGNGKVDKKRLRLSYFKA